MPFVQIQPKLRVSGMRSDKITMGAYLSEGPNKPKHILIRIPRVVMDTTKFVPINRAVILDLHEGVGDDTGFLMIYQTTDLRRGATANQSHKVPEGQTDSGHGYSASFKFERFQYYAPNEWPCQSTELNHILEDGNLIVECPDWFRPNIDKMMREGLWTGEKKVVKVEEPKRPLPRVNSADHDEVEVRLNRQERRALAHHVTRVLKR